MAARLILSGDLLKQVISHCKAVYPDEACGLLAGKGDTAEQIYKMTNTEKSSVSYMMDPQEQFRAMKEMRNKDLKMLAIYHSHPHSQAYPSPKDISLAFYSDQIYLIIGLTDKDLAEVRAFEILEGDVREVQIIPSVDAPSGDELNYR